MAQTLVQSEVVKKWDQSFAQGSDKKFPNLDLVRLEKWFFKSESGRLLEYAFGCGVNLMYLLECGYAIEAVDASIEAKKMVEAKLAQRPELEKKVTLHHITPEMERLPFEDESFDFVNCISVLSLLGNKEKVQYLLGEFVRVLKDGGKIIVDINGPQSDFARVSEDKGADIYIHKGFSGDEMPFYSYCPPDEKVFAELVQPYFEIDDVGYSSHKYFHSEIQEFIICAHKRKIS